MKKIEVDVFVVVGILLIVIGLTIGIVFYYSTQEKECIKDPVAYANNNSDDYWWSYAYALKQP